MREKDNLADVLWAVVMWVGVVFFAFAAGIMVAEHKEPEKQPEPMSIVVGAPTAMKTEPVERETVLDICEDTYLRDDLPIDYETQMHLYGACLEFGIDYELALAVIEQETGFRNVTGDGGDSQGYCQVQKRWHADRMEELGVTDLMDPKSNFRVACHFLSECIEKYGLEKGLGYYNNGKAQVTSYSRSVMERMQKYGA